MIGAENHVQLSKAKKFENVCASLCTSSYPNPFILTDFNMFVDDGSSAT